MAIVNLLINGRNYEVACDEGQESHLQSIAREVDDRVRSLAYRTGQAAESTMLVLTLLMMADEMHDFKSELEALRDDIAQGSESLEHDRQMEFEVAVSKTMEEIAGRIEKIANQIENG